MLTGPLVTGDRAILYEVMDYLEEHPEVLKIESYFDSKYKRLVDFSFTSYSSFMQYSSVSQCSIRYPQCICMQYSKAIYTLLRPFPFYVDF